MIREAISRWLGTRGDDKFPPAAVTLTVVPDTSSVVPLESTGAAESSLRRESCLYMIPETTHSFAFAQHRYWSGICTLGAAVAAISAGFYLASQISAAQKLQLMVGLVSGICCILGLRLMYWATKDLLGKLRVNARGIEVIPRIVGFSIPWTDLAEWSVQGTCFEFKSTKSASCYTVALTYLGCEERFALQKLLRDCAPDKERPESAI